MLKHNFELQRIVSASTLFLHGVLKVSYVFPITVPPKTSGSCRFLLGVEKRPLSLIVGAVWFNQVDYGEFITDIFAHVADPEVEPLSVSGRLVVVL